MRWFAPQSRVCLLPDWETLPYDQFSPHQDLVSERLATLYRIQRGDFDVAVVPAATALMRLCPPSYIAGHTFFLNAGEQLSIERLREQLAVAGYEHVTQVVSPGEVCFRGGLIDLFPMGSALPYRIDLDDDVIDAIKTFDVDTQRTLYAVKEIRMLPAREFPLDDAGRAASAAAGASFSKATLRRSGSTATSPTACRPRGSSITCRSFSSPSRPFSTTCRRRAFSPCTTTSPMPSRVLARCELALQDGRRRSRPAAAPAGAALRPGRGVLCARPGLSAHRHTRQARRGQRTLAAFGLPPLAVDRRAQDPLAALKRFSRPPGCAC